MKFEGTKSYVTTQDLTVAVNAAITLDGPGATTTLSAASHGRGSPLHPLANPHVRAAGHSNTTMKRALLAGGGRELSLSKTKAASMAIAIAIAPMSLMDTLPSV